MRHAQEVDRAEPLTRQLHHHGDFTIVPSYILQTPWWTSLTAYTEREALIDLCARRTYAPHGTIINGRPIDLEVGDIPHSIRFLAKAWGWKKTKTADFLKQLQVDRILSRRSDGHPDGSVAIYHMDIQSLASMRSGTSGQVPDKFRTVAGQSSRRGQKEIREDKNLTTPTEVGVSLEPSHLRRGATATALHENGSSPTRVPFKSDISSSPPAAIPRRPILERLFDTFWSLYDKRASKRSGYGLDPSSRPKLEAFEVWKEINPDIKTACSISDIVLDLDDTDVYKFDGTVMLPPARFLRCWQEHEATGEPFADVLFAAVEQR